MLINFSLFFKPNYVILVWQTFWYFLVPAGTIQQIYRLQKKSLNHLVPCKKVELSNPCFFDAVKLLQKMWFFFMTTKND